MADKTQPPETITISKDLALEMHNNTWEQMSYWNYCTCNGWYCQCRFCSALANKNGAIEHKDDCLGVRVLEALKGAWE